MSKRSCLSLGIGALSAVTSAALGLLVLIAVPAAQAAPLVVCPTFPTLIMKCGCTITNAGMHRLGANISSADGLTPKGDCIDIKHSDATLDGDFFSADGAGSGVGVRILSGAVRATVQNFRDGGNIDDWDIGVEDDANSANINNNNIENNKTTNIFLKSVSKSVVNDFDADSAGGSCIVLKNSNQNTFQDFFLDFCGGDGITATGSNNNSFSQGRVDLAKGDGVNFKNSSRNSLSNFAAGDGGNNGNGGNGVAFTKNSNKNSLSGFTADGNGGDGVFIDPSSNDKVDDGQAHNNKLNGIEIAKGSKQDSVIFNSASENGGTDLLDNNAACANGKNVWENNCFGTSSPSTCIILSLGC